MAQGNATIKSVLSGDTVILMGAARPGATGPPAELTLTLSSLQAPRLNTRHAESAAADPFAWSSREFLRNLLIGKHVMFKVEYKIASINREFGSIWLEGQSVNVMMAAEGYAKVKSDSRAGEACQDLEEMQRVESIAMAEGKGMFGPTDAASTKSINYNGVDASSLLEQYRGQPIPALIDSFRDGASLRMILLEPMAMIQLTLSGIQCPRLNTVGKNASRDVEPEGPAPFAREAKHFSEIRLLNREVKVLLEGVDSHGNFAGSIVHKAGNLSAELLKHGLAKMVDWSAVYLPTTTRTSLRAAEKEAKRSQVRVWQSFVPKAVAGAKQYSGKVIEVSSGDSFVILATDGTEKRMSLASCRAPRLGNARKQEPAAPYALEAKELARVKTIGKAVTVTIDYEREMPVIPGSTAALPTTRAFGNLVLATKEENIALFLVSEGLITVVRHRADDERSRVYDDLLGAEVAAQAAHKGQFATSSTKPSNKTAPSVIDLSSDSVKAKQYLPFLKREKTLRGIVEFVATGTRVKVFIPKENCLINFVASGIKCPGPDRRAGTGVGEGKTSANTAAEPFGNDARRFCREHLMQRNVEIEVEDMDRNGTAFGPIFIGHAKNNRVNYGATLLATGYAATDAYTIERTRVAEELLAAEKTAQAGKKNRWQHPIVVKSQVAPVTTPAFSAAVIPVAMSEILSGGSFYLHKKSQAAALSQLEAKMKAFTQEKGLTVSSIGAMAYVPKRGVTCAAIFKDASGSSWYRAKIEAIHSSSVTVRYMDYGNSASLPLASLRALDPVLMALPPMAMECILAFVKVPLPSEDYGQEAGHLLSDLAWGHKVALTMLSHGKNTSNQLRVSLFEGETNLAQALVTAGVARIDRASKRLAVVPAEKSFYEQLLALQQVALKSRLNLWQYGDIESDDEATSGY